MINVGNNCDVS